MVIIKAILIVAFVLTLDLCFPLFKAWVRVKFKAWQIKRMSKRYSGDVKKELEQIAKKMNEL